MTENTRTGFVGLGRMGQSMALNMARRGFALSVFDTRADQMQPFTAFNECAQAGSPAEAASGSEVAITVLPGPAEVDAVVLGPGGMLEAMAPGSLLMDLSTILPDVTDRIAAACKSKGVAFVDAPIGRLASHADAGESLFMVGAEDGDFERVKPMLEAMGTTILHCGGPGAGTRAKLVNNYLAITSCWMNAEAMALTQAFGLDLEKTLEVIHGTSATNGQLKMNYATKVFQGDIEPGFQIDLAHKDLSLIVESAQRLRAPMPVAAAAREALNSARAAGWGAKDFSGLADYACEMAGVEKPRLG
ncbi:MAG: NAD(P)-binding domain-containing protein [Alphaproteobacteria bacterium]|nr:NAD(P)-binding domain-containing protein [Alphaproteobacteria bacterium]